MDEKEMDNFNVNPSVIYSVDCCWLKIFNLLVHIIKIYFFMDLTIRIVFNISKVHQSCCHHSILYQKREGRKKGTKKEEEDLYAKLK